MSSKKDTSSFGYFYKFPNTEECWEKWYSLLPFLNSGFNGRFKVSYKYNGKSIPGVYKRGWFHCKKEYATEVRVYVNVKDKIRDREYVAKKRWEKQAELHKEERRHERRMLEIEKDYAWYLHN